MNVVGFDLSLARTGIAAPGRAYSIASPHKGAERLAHLRREIVHAVRGCDADVAVLEAVVPGPNALAGQALAKLHGVAELALYDLGVVWVEVWPVHLKLWAGAGARCDKAEMLARARSLAVLTPIPDHDAADAWFCWAAGMQLVGRPVFVASAAQRTALAKVVVPDGLRRRIRQEVSA